MSTIQANFSNHVIFFVMVSISLYHKAGSINWQLWVITFGERAP